MASTRGDESCGTGPVASGPVVSGSAASKQETHQTLQAHHTHTPQSWSRPAVDASGLHRAGGDTVLVARSPADTPHCHNQTQRRSCRCHDLASSAHLRCLQYPRLDGDAATAVAAVSLAASHLPAYLDERATATDGCTGTSRSTVVQRLGVTGRKQQSHNPDCRRLRSVAMPREKISPMLVFWYTCVGTVQLCATARFMLSNLRVWMQ